MIAPGWLLTDCFSPGIIADGKKSSLVILFCWTSSCWVASTRRIFGDPWVPPGCHHELSSPTPLRQQFHLEPSQWLHDGSPTARSAAAKPRSVARARGEAPAEQPAAACRWRWRWRFRLLLLHLQCRQTDDGCGGGHAVRGGGPSWGVQQRQDSPGHWWPADRLVRAEQLTRARVSCSGIKPYPAFSLTLYLNMYTYIYI